MFRFIPLWVPLFIYPLAEKLLLVEKLLADAPFGRFFVDFSLRPTWVPLVIYPLAENLLADVPFGRFFASSHLGALSDLPSGRVVALSIYPFAMFSLAMHPLADFSFPPTWVPLSIYFLA